MNKIYYWIFIGAIFISACGQINHTIPDSPDAKATNPIVEKYITANETYNTDDLMALYADQLVWVDNGMNDGPFNKPNLDFLVRQSFNQKEIKVKFLSYLLTPDGCYAVLESTVSMPSKRDGKWVSTKAYAVLEFKDGKIINETWYYDGFAFN
jgi:hypothetical protein